MSALAFDPHKALAKIENKSGLRANRADGANPDRTLAQLAPLALSPARNAETRKRPAAGPSDWFAALAMVDPHRAPAGIDPGWWRELLSDARWLARHHAEAAAAIGWSASNLFGIRPHLGQGEGSLADRLEGARRLAFTSGVAHWQGEDREGWLWRRTLEPMTLIWEA